MGSIKVIVNFFMILILQVDGELWLVGYFGAVRDVAALLQYGTVQTRTLQLEALNSVILSLMFAEFLVMEIFMWIYIFSLE